MSALVLRAVQLGKQLRRPLAGTLPVFSHRNQDAIQCDRPLLLPIRPQVLRRRGQGTVRCVIELIKLCIEPSHLLQLLHLLLPQA